MSTVPPSLVVKLIENIFPEILLSAEERIKRNWQIGASHHSAVVSLLKVINLIPPHLLVLESQELIDFQIAITELETAVHHWKDRVRYGIQNKTGKYYEENPLKIIYILLLRCPDIDVPTEIAQLGFIQNGEFQTSLRLDIAAVNQSLANGEWKATTVIGGSLLEALLLWSVQEYERSDKGIPYSTAVSLYNEEVLNRKPVRDLEKWDLHALVKVSEELAIITEETAKACDLVRGYRNLIHPGRAKRMGQVCGRDTALLAVGAVECLIREFEGRG